jgi:hypothetical protein
MCGTCWPCRGLYLSPILSTLRDLAPSDFHLFTEVLGPHMGSDDEKTTSMDRLQISTTQTHRNSSHDTSA